MTTTRAGGPRRAADTPSTVYPRPGNPGPSVEPESDQALTAVTAIAGICASIVGILLVLVLPGSWPALLGALLVACVPPGAAVMCWINTDYGVVQAGLTLVLSLTVTAIVTAVLIWVKAWQPNVMIAVAFFSTVSCAARLWRWGIPRPQLHTPVNAAEIWGRVTPLGIGLAVWAYGLGKIQPASIGTYGLLASSNFWFVLGLLIVLGGGVGELLRRRPLAWLLSAYLIGLLFAIYAAVPLLYGAPEYAWVYKHIGIIEVLGHYGYVTDPTNIYQQWPALFTAVAAVSGLSQVGPLNFAAWAPLAFELADALLLLGIFRMLAVNRRAAYLALFLYEGIIAWVGQDYLSPQAFAYLLWLGIASIILRWLLLPELNARVGRIWRLRSRLLSQLPVPLPSSLRERRVAVTMIVFIYCAITAAHQLTPYMIIVGVGSLVVFGLLWRGWPILTILVLVAFGYLVPRYGLITSQFGGLFSGGSAISNASGVQDVSSFGGHQFTGKVVDVLAAFTWLLALTGIARRWRTLGEVAVPALLAFSPFVIVMIQSYGGEAIYRVYMFSSPWCAMLIADLLIELRAPKWRRVLVTCACVIAVALGLQGLYGAVASDGFTERELSASQWLISNARGGSILYTAASNFPLDEGVQSPTFRMLGVPAPLEDSKAWSTPDHVVTGERWLTYNGKKDVYVVFSQSMDNYVKYLGYPKGYFQMKTAVARAIGWTVVYHDAETTIYQVRVVS